MSIENLSERDAILENELNRCNDAHRCLEIADEAESDKLAMEAHSKCIRLYRQEEYMAGVL